VLTGYVPNPYDTLYAVSKRFGISEVQLVWLNAWMGYTDPQLKAGIGLNLDPARR
jgi:LysM repeat protein